MNQDFELDHRMRFQSQCSEIRLLMHTLASTSPRRHLELVGELGFPANPTDALLVEAYGERQLPGLAGFLIEELARHQVTVTPEIDGWAEHQDRARDVVEQRDIVSDLTQPIGIVSE